MAIEIERRFLVDDPQAALADKGLLECRRIRQGYFGRIGKLRRRIRILIGENGERSAVCTLKGPRHGLSRIEDEYPFDLETAEAALSGLPSGGIIEKLRYRIAQPDGHIWSVDRFEGRHAGLVLAEVELAHPADPVLLPPWVGKEISGDPRYGNSRLAQWPGADLRVAA